MPPDSTAKEAVPGPPLEDLLALYGPVLSVYDASGWVRFQGWTRDFCRIRGGQLMSGDVVLLCDFEGPVPHGLVFRTRLTSDAPDVLYGRCADGRTFRSSDGFTPLSDLSGTGWGTHRLVVPLRARRVDVTWPSRARIAERAYGLTNLSLPGGEPVTLRLPPNGLPIEIHLRPLRHYPKTLLRMEWSRDPAITCEAVVPGDIALDVASAVVERVTWLLSIAQGTRVNWLYREDRDRRHRPLRRIHESRLVKDYSGLAPIGQASADAQMLAAFVEGSYETLGSRMESWEIAGGLVDAVLDAKAEGDFLEIRGAKAVVALELMKNVFLRVPDCPVKQLVTTRKKFKKLRSQVAEAVVDAATLAGLPEAEGRKMTEHLSGLNRRSLRTVLSYLFAYLELPVSEQTMGRIISSRNALLHGGTFAGWGGVELATTRGLSYQATEYFLLMNVLDRLLLRVVGYRGQYWNRTNPIAPKLESVMAPTETDCP
jgi:hypothetical protein